MAMAKAGRTKGPRAAGKGVGNLLSTTHSTGFQLGFNRYQLFADFWVSTYALNQHIKSRNYLSEFSKPSRAIKLRGRWRIFQPVFAVRHGTLKREIPRLLLTVALDVAQPF